MDNQTNGNESPPAIKTSRRGFLKTSVAAGAAIGGMGASGVSVVQAAEPKSSKGLPINLQTQFFHNVETPDTGADWSARFQVQFLFPK